MDVPGARWLKADLHIHTIDDLAGGRAHMPDCMDGDAQSAQALSEYSRLFLQEAVERGVHILGITPHSPCIGDTREFSAVWRIVEEWRNGRDSRGVPFRDSIYAVFPGFEPAFRDGKSGLHLLLLFDPDMGRDAFMQAFDLVMDGISPWSVDRRGLVTSGLHAEEGLERIKKFHENTIGQGGGRPWDYLVLAPHAEGEKGLFGALKGQVLKQFPHNMVAGLELGGNMLPDDAANRRRSLPGSMAEHNQWFFHGSDAYQMGEIGQRYTWIKIASPRIAALRQAFIAHQSRIRIGYERGAEGVLSETRPPDALTDGRPWLRSVTIRGGASFFGSDDGGARTRFVLSPDLTCIIGGSMTGKSTFLDGLRVHTGAPLPQDPGIREQAEGRGRDRFLAGAPEVDMDCPGSDTTAPLREQWPAVFYTQSEIRRLADNTEITKILSGLASKRDHIDKLESRLDALDKKLRLDADALGEISGRLADAEQAYERSRRAAGEISALSDAGIEELTKASAEARRWEESATAAGRLDGEMARLAEEVAYADIPTIRDHTAELRRAGQDETEPRARWDRVLDHLRAARAEAGAASASIRSAAGILKKHEDDARVRIKRRLAELGYDGAGINHIHATNIQASLLESYHANLKQTRSELDTARKSFERQRAERDEIVAQQRGAFDQVIDSMRQRFGGRIRAHRINGGDAGPLDGFIRDLGQRGITRWWNDLADERRPTPEALLEMAEAKRLRDVGMSDAVAGSFLAELATSRRLELAALRCRDTYQLEFMMDDGTYRRLEDLSGGQQVGLLLSLLLETDDKRPLVIDQPEDELDNRFLLETLLPALWRLKGRRQVILATHNANIVVNGDADQVIHLEATANRGLVAHSGAIEEPAVRDAIISAVDGGETAFRMRKVKYGF